MRAAKILIILGSVFVFHTGVILACEGYKTYPNKELKEYRDMLTKSDADPLDRMFAFEQLVCSDNPNLRNYAVKEGLNNAADPLVRNQVMLKAMMQKKRIDVELRSKKGLTEGDERFIATYSGVYSKNVAYRSEEEGYLSLNRNDWCDPQESVFIKGDKVEYNRGNVVGVFQLSKTGELIGFLRAQAHPSYSRIPAVIKLF